MAMDPGLMRLAVHYTCPALIFACLLATAVFNRGAASKTDDSTTNARDAPRGLAKQCLIIFIVLTYVSETAIWVVHTLRTDNNPEQHVSIFLLTCILQWLYILARGSKFPYNHVAPAVIAILSESALIVVGSGDNLELAEKIALFVTQCLRAMSATILLATAVMLLVLAKYNSIEETQPLLGGDASAHANGSANGSAHKTYGAIDSDEEEVEIEDRDKTVKERWQKRYDESKGWYAYVSEYFIFIPLLLPRKDRKVGLIAEKLTTSWSKGPSYAPFTEVAVLAGLSWLQSTGLGVISEIAQVPIEQFGYRRVTEATFNHVMGLSVDFHVDQNSGELMRALNQGGSITDLLRMVIIELAPRFLDIFISLGYLYFVFGTNACIAIILAGVFFFWIDSTSTNWTLPVRRRYQQKTRDEWKVLHESVQGWQTVTYFNRFDYESQRMSNAIHSYQKYQAQYTIRRKLVSLGRGLAIDLGFLCILLLAVLRVSRGQADIGSFVTLYAYWGTIIAPVGFLGGYYRWLTSKLIDAERLLQLFQVKPTIIDTEDAEDLLVKEGSVQLHDIHFGYDPRKETIKGISVNVQPGSTVAFVGETGAGKSTLLKLLYRLYDVTSGSISIDGQDIRHVTLRSLREIMGVVPQDPMLFNTSILDNVRYARLQATDEEVFEACKAACMHDKILSFPDGYHSKVGERGVKLSGGELQRVAIARVLLKQPRFVLLDEATSAIDTETEQHVQAAFQKLSEGRTTLVIAHRLSTIVKADLIVVLEDGVVIERGTHQSLLDLNGKYARLWAKQVAHI
ncbi:hypothetical protein FH972_022018 [Carpinus fangiana]|uniref:ABC transporter domain-containing protein n=1 Tax=Carpinus fangiana TaxID=176857 RepID=A0A5N6KR06_9ROSI|nr:hypothetical protein FH972_022018 [Carpinus fangiana]